MFKFLKRKLTNDLTEIPLLWIAFNYQHYHTLGKKDSCVLKIHPNLANDEHIKNTLNDLVDYIRDNYDLEDI